MAGNLVLFHKKDHIGYVTLNSPETGNRLSLEMIQELAEVCAQINGDEDVYLAVITGAGEVFCSGEGGDVTPGRYSAAEAAAGIDRPTLAALNGDAIGDGLELALACDLRISSKKARMGLPQITRGRIPLDGGTQRLSRIVGKGKALEIVLTGEIIDAQAAFEIGLVNKVVGGDTLNTEVEAFARAIATKAPLAMR
jgi:enoyl-CoA hydratase